MTDELETAADLPAKSGKKANQTSFKKGYDPRRWLNGRGKSVGASMSKLYTALYILLVLLTFFGSCLVIGRPY